MLVGGKGRFALASLRQAVISNKFLVASGKQNRTTWHHIECTVALDANPCAPLNYLLYMVLSSSFFKRLGSKPRSTPYQQGSTGSSYLTSLVQLML